MTDDKADNQKPLVDIFPLPWVRPDMRELQVALTELYPTSKAAAWVAASSKVDTSLLYTEQPPFFIWYDLLDLAARSGRLRDLVQFVAQQQSGSPRAALLQSALAGGVPAATDSVPRDGTGAPKFLSDDDQVTEKEALLFHDDLTMQFGRIPWLIGVLQRLQTIGASVCKFDTSTASRRQVGTGFRIADDLLLTNWHVLNFETPGEETPATRAVAEFGFEDDGKDGGLPSQAIACDVTSVKGDPDLDWAIVRVAKPMPATVPVLDLTKVAEPVLQAPAFVIQHPGGERKRIAFVRNQVTSFDDEIVHYLSDTQAGSSGAPVLDDAGRLIALHRAGGRPQEVAGKQPLRKNEGVRISQVVAGLNKLGVELQ